MCARRRGSEASAACGIRGNRGAAARGGSSLAATDQLEIAFRFQAGGSKVFGSPLYERLCEEALADVGRKGPVYELLQDWQGDPIRGFLPLRLLGAVHERVLAGEAPALARFYPSAGGSPEWPGLWQAFLEVIETQSDALRPHLENFPQTNEVRRCSGLLGGFLVAASRTGLPLRIRELGCSAGLNLHWDRYRYELGSHLRGDASSRVRMATRWKGGAPPRDDGAAVASRAGCDLSPRRVEDPDQARLLEAYVWPDQVDRLEPLRAAIALARERPARVDQAAAGDWLSGELAVDAGGECTVVFHSAFWLYLSPEEQGRVRALMEERGARATPRTPLAWLRHEDGEVLGHIEVRLRLWPGGEDRLLARSHPHGREVEWYG